MINLVKKEFCLSASLLSVLFPLFGFTFFLPGYPVLCGAFFVTLGIFQSFQNLSSTNDILFSVLLPVAKREVVKGKYLFCVLIELIGALPMGLGVLLRNTVLVNAACYRENALMNANGYALGLAFVIFGLFNTVFLGGFFKTGYRIGRPFVVYAVLCFLLIGLGETLPHFPGAEGLNAFGAGHLGLQLLLLLGGVLLFSLLTLGGYLKSCRNFEKVDL